MTGDYSLVKCKSDKSKQSGKRRRGHRAILILHSVTLKPKERPLSAQPRPDLLPEEFPDRARRRMVLESIG